MPEMRRRELPQERNAHELLRHIPDLSVQGLLEMPDRSKAMKPVDLIFPAARRDRANGICPTCGKEIGKFRDKLSLKEFGISGMCQACQDSVFGE